MFHFCSKVIQLVLDSFRHFFLRIMKVFFIYLASASNLCYINGNISLMLIFYWVLTSIDRSWVLLQWRQSGSVCQVHKKIILFFLKYSFVAWVSNRRKSRCLDIMLYLYLNVELGFTFRFSLTNFSHFAGQIINQLSFASKFILIYVG